MILNIISWNLLHTGGAQVGDVKDIIEQHSPDLVLMQEATSNIDMLPESVGGYYQRITLPDRHHGLAAWSKNRLQGAKRSLPLQRGIIVRRVVQILNLGVFTIANVHLSHGQFLNRIQLNQISFALPERSAIIGDCNMVGPPMLKGYNDVGPRTPTHRSIGMIPLRLDRCFVRGLRCLDVETLDSYTSDHCPIRVVLSDN